MKTYIKISFIILMLFNVKAIAQKDSLKFQKMQELETVFKEKIKTDLNVDESTADKLMKVEKEYRQNSRNISKERKSIYKTIIADPDALDIGAKLIKIIELERQSVDQKEIYYNELKTFLTPQQIAKSISIKKKFNKELKKEIRKRGKNKNK